MGEDSRRVGDMVDGILRKASELQCGTGDALQ